MKVEIEQEELDTLRHKAERFDKIDDMVAKFYVDEEGEPIEEDQFGLDSIGEAVASELGYL